jgi:hypothetical protein
MSAQALQKIPWFIKRFGIAEMFKKPDLTAMALFLIPRKQQRASARLETR